MEREWQKSDRLRRRYTNFYDAGVVQVAIFDEADLALNIPRRGEKESRDFADVSFSPDMPLLRQSTLTWSRYSKSQQEMNGTVIFELPTSWQTTQNLTEQLDGFVAHLKDDLVFEDIEHRPSSHAFAIYSPAAKQSTTVSFRQEGALGIAETRTAFTHKNTPNKHELYDGLVVGASIWAKLQDYIARCDENFSHLDEPIFVGTTRDLHVTDTELAFGTVLTRSELDHPRNKHPALSEAIDWMTVQNAVGSLSPAVVHHAIDMLIHKKRIRYGIHGDMEPITQEDVEISLGIRR